MRAAGMLLLVSLAACGPASHGARGAGAGPKPPPMASPGQDAIVDDDWGVGLLVEPAITTRAIDEQHFRVATVGRGDLAAGVFAFSIEKDPVRAGAGSQALARAAREDVAKGGGAELSEVLDVEFLGRAGHAFTFRNGDAFGLTVEMAYESCVFELTVLRSGRAEWMTQYASTVLRNIKPLTGGPVVAARCAK
jgi:hypothetical protein